MAQSNKAAPNSTADKLNSKGVKVSGAKLKAVKGRTKASQIKKRPEGRPVLIIDYDKVIEYSSQSIPNKDIAKALDMSVSSFYNYLNNDPEFKKSYEQGMKNRKYELEKALYRRAEGYSAEEKKTVVTDDPEKGTTVQTTVTEKNYVPDTTALIFTLSNIYNDKYKQRGAESKLDINVNFNDMRQLSNAELEKLASNAIIDAVEYQILE